MTTRTYRIQCGTDYPDEGVFFFFFFFSLKERFICWVTQAQLLGPISGKSG